MDLASESPVAAAPVGQAVASESPAAAAPAAEEKKKMRHRCGQCDGCLATDCGVCLNCLDKPKFGGPNMRKQPCIQRKCTAMGTYQRPRSRGPSRGKERPPSAEVEVTTTPLQLLPPPPSREQPPAGPQPFVPRSAATGLPPKTYVPPKAVAREILGLPGGPPTSFPELVRPRKRPQEAVQELAAEAVQEVVAVAVPEAAEAHLTKPKKKRRENPYNEEVGGWQCAGCLGVFASPQALGGHAKGCTALPAEPPEEEETQLSAEEALRLAEEEGLELRTSSNSATGFACVYKQGGPQKPYEARIKAGGKEVYLGCYEAAEAAALVVARYRPRTARAAPQAVPQGDLLWPQPLPRQQPPAAAPPAFRPQDGPSAQAVRSIFALARTPMRGGDAWGGEDKEKDEKEEEEDEGGAVLAFILQDLPTANGRPWAAEENPPTTSIRPSLRARRTMTTPSFAYRYGGGPLY